MVVVGDCRLVLAGLESGSVDAVVCDPPYELGFMGKSWDASGVAYDVNLWAEVLRVLKPGGHLLAFGGSRTYHRLACAVEDAGFEIRDQIMWVYGSGFPKSLDVSKALDKAAGVERQVVGQVRHARKGVAVAEQRSAVGAGSFGEDRVGDVTVPATDEARRWSGWGTALKPAHEPIVVARKPLDGTVANNVLAHGVGGLNIDGCRVGRADGDESHAGHRTATFGTQDTLSGGDGSGGWSQNDGGRWPANFIHDGSDEVLTLFPDSKSSATRVSDNRKNDGRSMFLDGERTPENSYGDSGSAARFFYCAKAGKKERNHGLDGFPVKQGGGMSGTADKTLKTGSGNERDGTQQNHHPTVKPVALMRYLVRLVTPPNGLVLDPFTGSGTTGIAAKLEGFNFIGIEQDAEYAAIAERRIASW